MEQRQEQVPHAVHRVVDITPGVTAEHPSPVQVCHGTPGIDLDYFAVRDARTLAVPEPAAREVVLLVAARLGSVHLIDNVRARLIARP